MKRLLTIAGFFVTLAAACAGEPTLHPGDNLVTVNVPPIPEALAESVERYSRYRTARFESWHPTKPRMLIATRFADTAQIHQVLFPGGARSQLTFFPDSVAAFRYQPTAGDYLVFSKDRGGDENFQNYR